MAKPRASLNVRLGLGLALMSNRLHSPQQGLPQPRWRSLHLTRPPPPAICSEPTAKSPWTGTEPFSQPGSNQAGDKASLAQ